MPSCPQDLIGENIFAILRARRAASTEALVMTAPLRSAGNQKIQTDGSVALMLALAAEFRSEFGILFDMTALGFVSFGGRGWEGRVRGVHFLTSVVWLKKTSFRSKEKSVIAETDLFSNGLLNLKWPESVLCRAQSWGCFTCFRKAR